MNSVTVEVCGRVGGIHQSGGLGGWGFQHSGGGGGGSSTFVVLRKDASTEHLHIAQYSIVCVGLCGGGGRG